MFELDKINEIHQLLKNIKEEIKKDEINQKKWDVRFLKLAEHISTWSKDPSTKVGAVIVDNSKIVVGIGYNGFPRGVRDTEERLNNRDLKYKFVCHAEVNSILQAGNKARGATLYVWPAFMLPPICNECCKLAVQAGIKEIVGYEADETLERAKRWKESIGISRIMCEEAGITWRGIKEELS